MSLHLDHVTGRYMPLTNQERAEQLTKIGSFVRWYANEMPDIDYGDIVCRGDVLLDIIEKVEKRRVYFHIFHGINMSEQNEVSLYCFWILKLAPFFNRKKHNHAINTSIATTMFLEAINRICLATQRRSIKLDSKYAKSLVYAFYNRDISKEAIMLIAKSLLVA
ncbi:MAG: hypothetical protein LBC70_03305 [Chitinispirillales bacterium]|nr:hypothetical protein [Chitinispirillales bacterium]